MGVRQSEAADLHGMSKPQSEPQGSPAPKLEVIDRQQKSGTLESATTVWGQESIQGQQSIVSFEWLLRVADRALRVKWQSLFAYCQRRAAGVCEKRLVQATEDSPLEKPLYALYL